MSTPDTRRDARRRRLALFVVAIVVGGGIAVGLAATGRGDQALWPLVILAGYGLVLLVFSRRSSTLDLIAGDASDERAASIQTSSAALVGHVLSFVLPAGFIWALIVESDTVFLWSVLCAVTAVVWLGSVVWFNRVG